MGQKADMPMLLPELASAPNSVLKDSDFLRLQEFLHKSFGLKMPVQKKVLLQSRLSKRQRALGIASIDDYCEFLFSKRGRETELVHMVDVVTTNKTDFFREPTAFKYLSEVGLPALLSARGELVPCLRVWSAACATGEEPYTLAMVLEDLRLARAERRFEYIILATDISSKALDMARRGVYGVNRVAPVPAAFRSRYLLQSADPQRELVRIVPELRRRVRFERLNLVDLPEISPRLDVIFCRNVIIYFDTATQQRLLAQMCDLLVPGGLLVMGHSESIHYMDLPLVSVGPMTYQRQR